MEDVNLRFNAYFQRAVVGLEDNGSQDDSLPRECVIGDKGNHGSENLAGCDVRVGKFSLHDSDGSSQQDDVKRHTQGRAVSAGEKVPFAQIGCSRPKLAAIFAIAHTELDRSSETTCIDKT